MPFALLLWQIELFNVRGHREISLEFHFFIADADLWSKCNLVRNCFLINYSHSRILLLSVENLNFRCQNYFFLSFLLLNKFSILCMYFRENVFLLMIEIFKLCEQILIYTFNGPYASKIYVFPSGLWSKKKKRKS